MLARFVSSGQEAHGSGLVYYKRTAGHGGWAFGHASQEALEVSFPVLFSATGSLDRSLFAIHQRTSDSKEEPE